MMNNDQIIYFSRQVISLKTFQNYTLLKLKKKISALTKSNYSHTVARVHKKQNFKGVLKNYESFTSVFNTFYLKLPKKLTNVQSVPGKKIFIKFETFL